MRKEFVETNSRKKALQQCPWASFIAKREGGYRCYEGLDDYRLDYGDGKIPLRHLTKH